MNKWLTRTEKADMHFLCWRVIRINWRLKSVDYGDTPEFHSKEPTA